MGDEKMTDEEIKKLSDEYLDELEDSGIDLDDWSIEDAFINGGKFINDKLEKENEELEYALNCEIEERCFVEHKLDLFKTGDEYKCLQDLCSCYKKENEELKAKLYSDSKNVFAELNDETAKSNAELLDMVEDLKSQIEKMKCCKNCNKMKGCNVCYVCKRWNNMNTNDFWEMKK